MKQVLTYKEVIKLQLELKMIFLVLIILFGFGNEVVSAQSLTSGDLDPNLVDLAEGRLGLASNQFERLLRTLTLDQRGYFAEYMRNLSPVSESHLAPVGSASPTIYGTTYRSLLERLVDDHTVMEDEQEMEMIQSTHFIIFIPYHDPVVVRYLPASRREEIAQKILALLELTYAYNQAMGSQIQLSQPYPVVVGSLMAAYFPASDQYPFSYISLSVDLFMRDDENGIPVLRFPGSIAHEVVHFTAVEGGRLSSRYFFGLHEALASYLESLFPGGFSDENVAAQTIIRVMRYGAFSEQYSYAVSGVFDSAASRGINLIVAYYEWYNDKSTPRDFRDLLDFLEHQLGEDQVRILTGFYIGALNEDPNGLYGYSTSPGYAEYLTHLPPYPTEVDSFDIASILQPGIGGVMYYQLHNGQAYIPGLPGCRVYLVSMGQTAAGKRIVASVVEVPQDSIINVNDNEILLIVNEAY